MRLLPLLLLGLGACTEHAPQRVVLSPEGEQVEMVSDRPNLEIYRPVGAVRGEARGLKEDALRYARHDLRNQAARRGARLVAIEEVSARAARDLSGKTVVTIVGQAFKARD